MNHKVIVMWNEPFAKILNSVHAMLFHRSRELYDRFFSERSTSFDIDAITNVHATMSVMNAHHKYGIKKCNTLPWK